MTHAVEVVQRVTTTSGIRGIRMRMSRLGLRSFDVFALVNLALFLTVRLIQDAEFAFYMWVMAVIMVGLWAWLRGFDFEPSLLIAMEIGMIAHFAGGLLVFGDEPMRLYAQHFFGIRFDKIVHAYSSVLLVLVAWRLVRQSGIRVDAGGLWILPILAIGVGALWEIVEYAAVATMSHTGVGDYVNNAQDLVANLFGALLGTALIAWRRSSPSQ